MFLHAAGVAHSMESSNLKSLTFGASKPHNNPSRIVLYMFYFCVVFIIIVLKWASQWDSKQQQPAPAETNKFIFSQKSLLDRSVISQIHWKTMIIHKEPQVMFHKPEVCTPASQWGSIQRAWHAKVSPCSGNNLPFRELVIAVLLVQILSHTYMMGLHNTLLREEQNRRIICPTKKPYM